MPILFGLVSLALGQDTNWDLYNYHLYNPFALLNGKLHVDFFAAGFQSYFNPTLDIPYYLAIDNLPAPLVGFLMGWLHGMVFVLVLGIASHTLSGLPDQDRLRVPLLLAAAGCLTANFLSSLGNTMGDNTTALFGLASVLVILANWNRLISGSQGATMMLLAAGGLVGFGTGLKLTNSIYAVAIAAALLTVPTRWPMRLRVAFVFGIGTVLGVASTGGHWFWLMWRTFGNPVFPQFGTVFPNALVDSTGVYDAGWRPHGGMEVVLWPFIFSLNPLRVGQLPLHQVIWPIVYLLFAAYGLAGVLRRRSAQLEQRLDSRVRFTLVFFVTGYLLWMALFSIYRYLVTLEVIAPLVAFLLIERIAPRRTARRIAAWTLTGATLVVLAGGVQTWGHQDWSTRAFRADLPPIEDAARTTVVILTGEPPWAWLATMFPRDIAFLGISGTNADTATYNNRVQQMIRDRGGPVFAIVEGHYNWRADNIDKANARAAWLGLLSTEERCRAVHSIVAWLRVRAVVTAASSDSMKCRLGLPAADERDIPRENRESVAKAAPLYAASGFHLDAGRCLPLFAYAGSQKRGYQWCRLTMSQ